MKICHWNFISALTLSLPVYCSAATLSIDKGDLSCSDVSGSPYCLITAGLSAAIDGDILEVGAGTYIENLTIVKSITINGTGADTTIIDGGASDRTIFTQGVVAITGVTIQNGDAGDGGLGGGVWVNMGSLTLSDAVVKNNHASDGGGIGTAAALTLIRTLVSDNTASNTGNNSSGGGLYIGSDGVTIIGSTISNNVSEYSAGGIFNMGYATKITNSTLSGNMTSGDGGGGALVNGSGSSASVTLSSVTVTDNRATVFAGGILNANGEVRLHNTLVTGNTDPGVGPDCSGQTITSDGYNFIGSTTGCVFSRTTGDLLNQGTAAAGLDAIADNGGATPTHAILSGSEVIDAGDPSGCTDAASGLLTADQTGSSRTVDGNADSMPICDIGAFEFRQGLIVDAGDSQLVTTEGMGMATFEVLLVSQPTSDVTVSLSSSDISEGTVSPETMTFTATNWNVRQQAVITGVDDSETDGDISYTVSIGPSSSLDPAYDNISLADLNVTNEDDEGVASTSQGESSSGGGGAFDMLLLLMLVPLIGRRIGFN